jgi:hypothetical protein
MSYVFVVDTNKKPLNPMHPGRARILLTAGKAAVFKRFPFTIVLKHEVEAPVLAPLRIKIDPGSKTTGLALLNDATGLTKFNRSTRALPKTHWRDACCVGRSTPLALRVKGVAPLDIRANGRGCRQMCLMDKHGFPRTRPKAKKFKHAFRTGDIVRAVVSAHLNNPGGPCGQDGGQGQRIVQHHHSHRDDPGCGQKLLSGASACGWLRL